MFARGFSSVDWERLRGKRLFVTGGTGFVGCWLLEGLLWGNRQFQLDMAIDLLTRTPSRFRDKAPHLAEDPAICLIRGDVSDLTAVRGAYDRVIHAAADVGSPSTNPLDMYEAIVNGTRQAVELASRSSASRFLYLSSGAVYGPQPATIPYIPESYTGAPPLDRPASAYAQAKRASEWMVSTLCSQRSITWISARIFALTGPYIPLDGHFAMSNFLSDIVRQRPIKVKGGTGVRSYLYGADLALWLIALLTRDQARGTYNVGSQSAVTILDMARQLSMLAYGEPRLDVEECGAESLAGSQRYVPDVARATTTLGLQQYTDLDNALKHSIAWARLQSDRLSH
ncbi:hypothetical protein BAU08_25390 [Bordetella bronchialis]|uniref:NAD-dependent epimerase/dehydratase domain-containing protein n=1 Tax=Bordetella bronchialis TaxID=463025 RepID=A0A193FRI6_9BORD|nr:hypothetical protein BAU06_24815 [Bordetella bronchialis]ANN75063.1 hypothetical protein BAU08_25390 [Bordetella bronchialis]